MKLIALLTLIMILAGCTQTRIFLYRTLPDLLDPPAEEVQP